MITVFAERTYPYFMGAGIAAACWVLFDFFGVSPPNGEEMLSSIVSLGGIFAGFLATIKTLLMDMKPETIDRLRTSGYSKYLRTYLGEALWSSLVLCFFAIAGFSGSIGFDNNLYLCILFGMLACALSALHRVTRIGIALLAN